MSRDDSVGLTEDSGVIDGSALTDGDSAGSGGAGVVVELEDGTGSSSASAGPPASVADTIAQAEASKPAVARHDLRGLLPAGVRAIDSGPIQGASCLSYSLS